MAAVGGEIVCRVSAAVTQGMTGSPAVRASVLCSAAGRVSTAAGSVSASRAGRGKSAISATRSARCRTAADTATVVTGFVSV